MSEIKKFIVFIIVLGLFVILFKQLNIQNEMLKNIYKKEYNEYIDKYSQECNIDSLLIYSIVKAESNFDSTAISKSGAIGLMQLMENTAKELAKKENIKYIKAETLYNPESNIRIGVLYFKELLDLYNQNQLLALTAYNAGRGNVDKWIQQGVIKKDGSDIENIPYKETNMYVRKIIRNYRIYQKLYK